MTGRDLLEESLLREPHLEDAGFTEAVLGRLPPPRRDLRPWVLGAAVCAAALFAAAFLPGALAAALGAAAAAAPGVPPAFLAGAGACVVAAAAAGLSLALAD